MKEFFKKMNEQGIPIPLFRVDGKPSLTASFCVISFLTALFGQLGKFAKITGVIDLDSANYLFFGCLFAYIGRRMTGSKSNIEMSGEEKTKE